MIHNALDVELCHLFPSSLCNTTLCWITSLPLGWISSFQDLGQKFRHYFAAEREIIPVSDHLLIVWQQQFESVQAYTERFDKEALKVPNLSFREHIQAYKHGIRLLSLTKVLGTKTLLTVDNLLNAVQEFIKGEIRSEVNVNSTITYSHTEKEKSHIVHRI